MKWPRVFLFVVLALAVTAPGAAWGQGGSRYRPSEPGSVIIFPKFVTGTLSDTDGTTLPRSAFEISAVCPPGAPLTNLFCTDTTGKAKDVWIRFKWICPPSATSNPKYCAETNFQLKTTINGTLFINPENVLPPTGVDPLVTPPPCPQGFLIGWVIDGPLTRQPIAFNGLFGDAVLRLGDDSTHVMAYNAVTIQAVNNLAVGAPIPNSGSGSFTDLRFNGTTDYRIATRALFGNVRYEDANTRTFITLVALNTDAASTQNADNLIDFQFYNENEDVASGGIDLICWTEVELTTINPGLTTTGMQGLKGMVRIENKQAVNPDLGRAIVGLVDTLETIPGTSSVRGYAQSLYVDRSTTDSTEFSDPPLVPPLPAPVPLSAPPSLVPPLPLP